MALLDAALNVMADAFAAAATHLSLHSADPGGTGANETTAARQLAGWGSAATGDVTASNIAFTGGAASGAVTHVGYWSASTGGTFYGSRALTGDAAFNAAGEYTVTSVTENGSSS